MMGNKEIFLEDADENVPGSIPKGMEEKLEAFITGSQKENGDELPTGFVVYNEYTVQQLHFAINVSLKKEFLPMAVFGELSSFMVSASGHAYFTLKTGDYVLNAVCFSSSYDKWVENAIKNEVVSFDVENDSVSAQHHAPSREEVAPEIGQQLRCEGVLQFYSGKGAMQLSVDNFTCIGEGGEEEALKKIIAQLKREGLFLTERKKLLPPCVKRIALITSAMGAVRYDFMETLKKIFPHFEVLLFHINVENKPDAVIHQLQLAEVKKCEIAVLARGGGAKEDLHMWNDEQLVRYISNYSLPTISAIGHESDDVLTDMVCDFRASTPTQAAEKIALAKKEITLQVFGALAKAKDHAKLKVANATVAASTFSAKSALSLINAKLRNEVQLISYVLNRAVFKVGEKMKIVQLVMQQCDEISRPITSRLALLHGFSEVYKMTGSNYLRIERANEIEADDFLRIDFADGEKEVRAIK